MDVQDQAETTQTITVATQDGVDMKFNSQELIQSVNSGTAFDDLSKNYIEPAVKMLVSNIEADYLAYCTKATYQTVGTPGTAITTLEVPGKARAKLNQALAPKDNRNVQMDSVTMGGLVNGMASYFNPSNAIGKQYTEGLIARTGMADFFENERVHTQTIGSDITGVTLDTFTLADGGTAITVTGGATTVAGQVFTMAGVYDVHPETKVAYPHLKQFVLTSTSATAWTFAPAIQTTGANKNASALPSTTAAIVFVGAAGASYVQPIMYHKEAFQFITADLPLYDAQKCARRVQDGLSMRVWMDSDIRNDELLMRIDILYGMAALRPEWACRMIGSANA